MEEQGRVSRASSVITVSSIKDKADMKLQSFCKRSRSVQRDPNFAVVIRGWLYKRDSTGLKLWKRRWFVLSNYCLFYYKDSREECVLGSLPLPSYKIFFCSPRECKNRKYAFKVVHQGMRSYLFSADTQEDMLGWVRALSQSACMETDDLINRRCSSYHDFSQIGGSTESVNPPHVYSTPHNSSHQIPGGVDIVDHRGRHRATHSSSDIQTRSLSLDRPGEDYLLFQGSGPSTPQSHYESRSYSPVGRVDQRPQVYSTHYSPVHKAENKEIHSDNMPPLPHFRITPNSPGPLHNNTASVCVFPSYMHEKEMHTLTTIQGDTDMVLTCLCGCDKALQALSVELDLLQQDKEHAEFALDMSRIELSKGQLNERGISQKALLQEELVTIRARMCDLSQEMERVWLDYKRMESELCVFRSHLQHICHFGLPQEHSLAQKQIWMMDDILSGLKPNRSRFKALMALHTPTMFPLLHNSSLHSEESMHYWGEESEPPARPPLPLELNSTKESTKLSPDYKMDWRCEQGKLHNKRRQSPDNQMNIADQAHPHTHESSPVCVMHVMRAELPSALTAQRVCVEELNPEEDKLNTVDVCGVNRECATSKERPAKHKRVDRIRERALKSTIRRSDSAHPLKFVNIRVSDSHCERSADSLLTDKDGIHGNTCMTESDVPESPPSISDIKPSSTNHISTLMISKVASEETDQNVSCSLSTSQRAEWFLSTSHWQEFIPLNIQEEELSPSNQHSDTSTNMDSDTSTNQESELSTNLTCVRRPVNMTASLAVMETVNEKPSDPLTHQAIRNSADSHMIFQSDHSGTELCIFEDIEYIAPKPAPQDYRSLVGRAKAQQANLSTNRNLDSHLSVNHHASLVPRDGQNGAITDKTEKETGSNIITSDKIRQPIYSSWRKNSVTNPSESFFKPRVTVVSTSL